MVKGRREAELWTDITQEMMSEEEKVGKCMYDTHSPMNHTINLEIHVLKQMIRSVDYNDVSARADLVTLTDQEKWKVMCLKIKIVMTYCNKPISHHVFKICWNVNLISNKVFKQSGIKNN